MTAAIPALWSLLIACTPEVVRPPPQVRTEPAPIACLGNPPCEDRRTVRVDLSKVGGVGVVEVSYDFAEVTRRVRLAQMGDESDLSVAVRLLLGEVGPERLLDNLHAREEALSILSTVLNRLDPAVWNPEGQPAEPWPGCEAGASFAQCANSDQYYGLRSWRALEPAAHVDEALLEPAIGVVVRAWWLLSTGAATDPTDGATSFVHLCGGPAYGQPTRACDGQGDDDVDGAEPHTGPTVFRGPERWDPAQGRYRMWRCHEVAFARR